MGGAWLDDNERAAFGARLSFLSLFARRTIRGNLHVAGKQAGLSSTQIRAKADEVLKRFGIEEHTAKYPSQLSGGQRQRQRVAIAQQFMYSEHLLLMDEPFSGLDLIAQQRVMGFIQEMVASDELKTFILVTHDISAALQVCDTIWVLGRDRDKDGNVIPGARIEATYDLIERGLLLSGEYHHDARIPAIAPGNPRHFPTLADRDCKRFLLYH